MRRLEVLSLSVVLPAAVAAMAISGCGNDDAATAPTDDTTVTDDSDTDASSGGDGVVIDDFTFEPATVSAAPGEEVAVDNRDTAGHTVTATDEAFDTGTIDAGASGSFVAPEAPGTYEFICDLHPFMKGTLEVA